MAQNFTGNASRLGSLVRNFNRLSHSSFRIHNSQEFLRNPVFLTFRRWKTCWKCGVEIDNVSRIFCPKCSVLQRPEEEHNCFKIFGLKEEFNIDEQLLRNKFRQLQSFLHPDKFSNRTDEEQTISADYSSLINKAYDKLHVPLKRAEHLLELRGEPISEDQSVDEPEFLIEIMSLSEEVEDAGKDVKKLKELNAKNNQEIDKISKEINSCFEKNDIKKAKEIIIKMKYFISLSNRINGVLREMGAVD